jgi:hypothetical protein
MGRDEKRAYNILGNVAKTSTNAAHTNYYNEFMSLGDEAAKRLVSAFTQVRYKRKFKYTSRMPS